jgi:hypothetical protein
MPKIRFHKCLNSNSLQLIDDLRRESQEEKKRERERERERERDRETERQRDRESWRERQRERERERERGCQTCERSSGFGCGIMRRRFKREMRIDLTEESFSLSIN